MDDNDQELVTVHCNHGSGLVIELAATDETPYQRKVLSRGDNPGIERWFIEAWLAGHADLAGVVWISSKPAATD